MSDFSTRRIERRQNLQRHSSSHSHSSRFFWGGIVGIIVILFGLYSYIAKTGEIIIPAGTFVLRSGDTVFSLNESQKFGIGEWRYKMYVRFFAPTPSLKQ